MSDRERLDDLLAARATEGLDAAETAELEALLRAHPEIDPDAYDRAAAALDLAWSAPFDEEMPAELRARLEPPPAPAPAVTPWSALGWVAAAATILVALIVDRTPEPPPPAERMRTLAAQAPDLVRYAWTGLDPAYGDVAGEVVWSDARQEGYMRFRGLPVNDPAERQYQLWIVDPERDARPVDGGVFDVTVDGEVVVPIASKLAVRDVKAFVVTSEQPGGVVVSDGPHLVIAAP